MQICISATGLFRAAVPSGASTGIYEALEMRDKDPKAYHGKGEQNSRYIFHTRSLAVFNGIPDITLRLFDLAGVFNAVTNVNKVIAPAFVGKDVDVTNQTAVDKVMLDLDGTENKCEFQNDRLC